ncbi:uncharacterized protein LOC110037006, partial [Phalaenopsis equestris]|uniref:uncharacterized protein LOC110037006 n=1 Tax=Phalaenopsis equestris TaxID=78828 RepID=UPI0009E1EB1D
MTMLKFPSFWKKATNDFPDNVVIAPSILPLENEHVDVPNAGLTNFTDDDPLDVIVAGEDPFTNNLSPPTISTSSDIVPKVGLSKFIEHVTNSDDPLLAASNLHSDKALEDSMLNSRAPTADVDGHLLPPPNPNLAWSFEGVGDPWYILWQLHKKVASALRRWNYQVFGNVHTKIQETQAEVDALETMIIFDPQLVNEVAYKHSLLLDAISMEEHFLQQKANDIHFKSGDCNTNYFHASIKHRRIINSILKIKKPNGDLIADKGEIGNNDVQYFIDLFASTSQVTPKNSDFFDKDRDYVAGLSLIDILIDQEIFNVLKDTNPNKAPSPDGFTSSIYTHYWDIIHKEVVAAIQSFFM